MFPANPGSRCRPPFKNGTAITANHSLAERIFLPQGACMILFLDELLRPIKIQSGNDCGVAVFNIVLGKLSNVFLQL